MVVFPCEQCNGTGRITLSDQTEESGESPGPSKVVSEECLKCGGRGYWTSADGVKEGIDGPIF